MEIKCIDAHTHVQFPEFDDDRKEVILRACTQGIGIINVGTDEEQSKKAVELAHEYSDGVWATVGYHPHTAETLERADIKEIQKLAYDKRVVGIGECGLDYFRINEDDKKRITEKQKEIFTEHIQLAHTAQKPIVLHVRTSGPKLNDAFYDVLEILHSHKNILKKENPGICHFFTGTKDIAKRFLDLNFSFTFGGLITYNREFDEVLEYIPADHLLVETDAPFVPPKSHRGHRNEPSFITETVAFLADFKKVSTDIFFQNTKNIFGI